MNTATEKARFGARIPKHQKEYLERAARLMGYNLTDFVISAAQERAEQVVAKHEEILTSERDRKVFFEAVTGTAAGTLAVPNATLQRAARRYQDWAVERHPVERHPDEA